MTNDEDGEITWRMLLQYIQAMEAVLLDQIDDLYGRLTDHIDRSTDRLCGDLHRLGGKVDALVARVDAINARLGAVASERGDLDPCDAYAAVDEAFRDGWSDPVMDRYDEHDTPR